MTRLKEKQKLNIQFWLGVAMIVAGLTLLFMGFWTVPIGEISNSVLIALIISTDIRFMKADILKTVHKMMKNNIL